MSVRSYISVVKLHLVAFVSCVCMRMRSGVGCCCGAAGRVVVLLSLLFLPNVLVNLTQTGGVCSAQSLGKVVDWPSDLVVLVDELPDGGGKVEEVVSVPSDSLRTPVVYVQRARTGVMAMPIWSVVVVLTMLVALLIVSLLLYRRHAEQSNQRLLDEFENLKMMHINQYQMGVEKLAAEAQLPPQADVLSAVDRHNALNNDEHFLQSIRDLLDEDFSLASNVEKLADRLNMTTQTFRRHLKSATGELPKTYLSQIRMERACSMLINSDVSLVEIAEQCGFTDASNFTRSFRKDFGMTPSSYRQKKRKNGKRQLSAEREPDNQKINN